MDLLIGNVVISLAGRDKGRYLAVLKIDNDYVYLADGKLRIVENPKKKNVKHVSITGTKFESDVLTDNKKLHRSIIEKFGAERR